MTCRFVKTEKLEIICIIWFMSRDDTLKSVKMLWDFKCYLNLQTQLLKNHKNKIFYYGKICLIVLNNRRNNLRQFFFIIVKKNKNIRMTKHILLKYVKEKNACSEHSLIFFSWGGTHKRFSTRFFHHSKNELKIK